MKNRGFYRAMLATLVVSAMVFTLVLPAAANDSNGEPCGPCGTPQVSTLYAGQDMDVGTVTVMNCEDKLCVLYELNDAAIAEGWLITETHTHAAGDVGDIPHTKKGNPIPGHFSESACLDPGATEYKVCFDLEDLELGAGDTAYIAAHAVVELPELSHVEARHVCIVSDADTLYYNGSAWVPSSYSWVHPSWNGALSMPLYNDAEWIWETGPASSQAGRTYVDDPIDGDIIEFERDFTIEGAPTGGTLWVTTDNGYEAGVNGTTVGSAQLYGEWRTSNLAEPFCDRDGWQSVETWDVSPLLAEGANTIAVTGVNEYMGPLDGESNGTVTSNPGGLIYKLCADSEVTVIDREYEEETAWGDGEDFDGNNWATYIEYEIQPCEMEEVWPEGGTLSVAYEDLPLASGNDWDYNDFVADISATATFTGLAFDRDLTEISFTVTPQAKIAGYTHVMHFAAGAFGCDGDYELYHNGALVASGAYDDSAGLDVVVVPNTGSPQTDAQLVIAFDPGCDFEFPTWDDGLYHGENLFFDPYIHVNNTGQDVHTGDSRMLTVPIDWTWPTPDGNAIWNVYPKVTAGNLPTFVPYWWTP